MWAFGDTLEPNYNKGGVPTFPDLSLGKAELDKGMLGSGWRLHEELDVDWEQGKREGPLRGETERDP